MITIGLDPHPGSHTVVALDENGTSLGYLKVPDCSEGIKQLHQFAARFSLVLARLYPFPDRPNEILRL